MSLHFPSLNFFLAYLLSFVSTSKQFISPSVSTSLIPPSVFDESLLFCLFPSQFSIASPYKMTFTVNVCATVVIASFAMVFAAAKEVHVNFLLGSKATLVCHSSYPPPWTKMSDGQMTIIGVNGEKHANWDEPRFHFAKNGSVYSVIISGAELKDAGTYACGSNSPVSFIVSVIR